MGGQTEVFILFLPFTRLSHQLQHSTAALCEKSKLDGAQENVACPPLLPDYLNSLEDLTAQTNFTPTTTLVKDPEKW